MARTNEVRSPWPPHTNKNSPQSCMVCIPKHRLPVLFVTYTVSPDVHLVCVQNSPQLLRRARRKKLFWHFPFFLILAVVSCASFRVHTHYYGSRRPLDLNLGDPPSQRQNNPEKGIVSTSSLVRQPWRKIPPTLEFRKAFASKQMKKICIFAWVKIGSRRIISPHILCLVTNESKKKKKKSVWITTTTEKE